MNTWIFQGNPDKFDIDDYLQKSRKIYWSVTHPKHQRELSIGDEVYIWRAKGSNNAISGVVAFGIVDEECTRRDQVRDSIALYDNLWIEPHNEASEIKAGILISDLRLTLLDGMLTSDELKKDPILSNMQILKSRVGSNFLLKKFQSEIIKNYWEAMHFPDNDDFTQEFASSEGKIKVALHKVRERNPRLRKLAIDNFLKKNGRLFCEVCGFSFEDTYGKLGEGFIEVHHLRPISEYEENDITTIDDLKLVCSNCHSMLHRGDPSSSNTSLREKLFKISSK